MSQVSASVESWGRFPKARHLVKQQEFSSAALEINGSSSVLPFGQGRSYGDCCLNDGATLLATRFMDRLLAFDSSTGVLRCEAGITLGQILEFCVPRGWFLPVSPGTKFISLGGAIANDVHGKNHHSAGSFGRHVLSFELARSDGSRTVCSPSKNGSLFAATIAGMGLTGLITWAEIQLQPIRSAFIQQRSVKFANLTEFKSISRELAGEYVYSVAWLDCVSSGSGFGRGIFMAGNHAGGSGSGAELQPHRAPKLACPIDFPGWVLNRFSISAFNFLYYHRQFQRQKDSRIHYEPFFYPLDAIANWNRIYGKRGFFQFQCVLPPEQSVKELEALLRIIVDSGQGSFLAVLKEFGDVPSPGLLSFPRPGTTLALDFAHRGESTLRLLTRLDDFVRERGGAIYPAKDAVMSADSFKSYFPGWQKFLAFVDPKFSSSFARRVGLL